MRKLDESQKAQPHCFHCARNDETCTYACARGTHPLLVCLSFRAMIISRRPGKHSHTWNRTLSSRKSIDAWRPAMPRKSAGRGGPKHKTIPPFYRLRTSMRLISQQIGMRASSTLASAQGGFSPPASSWDIATFPAQISESRIKHISATGCVVLHEIRDNIGEFLSGQQEQYDFIHMSHVIEHVPKYSLLWVVDALYLALKRGGTLFLRTTWRDLAQIPASM